MCTKNLSSKEMYIILITWGMSQYSLVHFKFQTINLHNATCSLISRKPREWMFVLSPYCHISLSYITKFSLMQTTKEVNPHPRITPCFNMWSVFFFFFFFCRLLNVGACVHHVAREGQVEWTTLTQMTGERIQIALTSPLCYSILSHATLILQYHASILHTTKLCNTTCTLIATDVILQGLECMTNSLVIVVFREDLMALPMRFYHKTKPPHDWAASKLLRPVGSPQISSCKHLQLPSMQGLNHQKGKCRSQPHDHFSQSSGCAWGRLIGPPSQEESNCGNRTNSPNPY